MAQVPLPNNLIAYKYFIIALILHVQVVGGCLTLHGESREIMDARQILNEEANIASCLKGALQNGKIGFAQSIVSTFDEHYDTLFIGIFEKQLNRLKLINEQIVLGSSSCEPVLKWSQNISHIFVSMKMSHRWDSPPCLSTKHESSQLTANYFEYINVCIVSHQKITFQMKLSLYNEVVGSVLDIHKNGVGTYSAIVQKKQHKVWPFLSKNEVSYQTWEQIAERYNPIYKEYQVMLDQIMRQRRSKPVELNQKSNQNNTNNQQTEENNYIQKENKISDESLIDVNQENSIDQATIDQVKNGKEKGIQAADQLKIDQDRTTQTQQ